MLLTLYCIVYSLLFQWQRSSITFTGWFVQLFSVKPHFWRDIRSPVTENLLTQTWTICSTPSTQDQHIGNRQGTHHSATVVHVVKVTVRMGTEVKAGGDTGEWAAGFETQSTFWRLPFKLCLILKSIWCHRFVQGGQQGCQHMHSFFHFLLLKYTPILNNGKTTKSQVNSMWKITGIWSQWSSINTNCYLTKV